VHLRLRICFFLRKFHLGLPLPAAGHSLLPARRWSCHVPLTCGPARRVAGDVMRRGAAGPVSVRRLGL